MSFKITGIHHVELTVSDLERSKKFYSLFPNFKLVAEHPNFSMFFSGNFYLGLTDHKGDLKEKVFDEHTVGLDHMALTVSSQEDLIEAQEFFDDNCIQRGEIQELSNGTVILPFRDPDNIQLEFAWKKS